MTAEPNGVCRTGCKAQDHASYGECLRDARIGIDLSACR